MPTPQILADIVRLLIQLLPAMALICLVLAGVALRLEGGTLCDRARLECPTFPEAELVHWHFDDPLAIVDHTKRKRLFRSLRDQMAHRVRLFALVHARVPEVDNFHNKTLLNCAFMPASRISQLSSTKRLPVPFGLKSCARRSMLMS